MPANAVPPLRIVAADLDDGRVLALLETHYAAARAQTAPGSAHALDLAGLRAPDIRLCAAWSGGDLLGIGALRALSPGHGEIKSMHVAERARGRGVGSTMLRHLLDLARRRGLRRVSLETGSWPYFEPARALYRRHGFVDCAPFGDYAADANSAFMTLCLDSAGGESRA